jgi:creatinine amidohydrolase/Fe(II)-dependent formamide hydrolase-like protein
MFDTLVLNVTSIDDALFVHQFNDIYIINTHDTNFCVLQQYQAFTTFHIHKTNVNIKTSNTILVKSAFYIVRTAMMKTEHCNTKTFP